MDWPTAGFYRELAEIYPSAKFVLTVRSPESWVDSFSGTNYPFVAQRDRIRNEMLPWIEMAARVIHKTGFIDGLDVEGLRAAYVAHNEAVRATIPAQQLLV